MGEKPFVLRMVSAYQRAICRTLAGRTNRTKFRDQVLKPLLTVDFIEMTIPDKPRSSQQKYRLTKKGHAWLKKVKQ